MNTINLAVNDQVSNVASVSTWRDWLGIVASIGCAIHCAAMPFVIAYLPALGLSFLADEAFHKWMALICFLIAIVAFIPGIRRHGSWVPVSIGAVGLAAITYAAFGLAGECCSSCAGEDGEAAVACADPCCDACAADSDAPLPTIEGTGPAGDGEQLSAAMSSSSAEVKVGNEKDLLAVLAPWITPFGGVLLVTAHLVNRRYGYSCGCCGGADVKSEA